MKRRRKSKNIILDLDNTLISSESYSESLLTSSKIRPKLRNCPVYNMDNLYWVFERPYLQMFLDKVFSKYNVTIWTSATKDYALFIIKNILLKKTRHLDYILFSNHCSQTNRRYRGQKDVRMLWNYYKLPGYFPENTLLLDDLDNSRAGVHIIEPFEIMQDNSHKDSELLKLARLL